MAGEKDSVFWLVFASMVIGLSSAGFVLAEKLYVFSSFVGGGLAVLVFALVVLPLSAVAARMVMNYAHARDLNQRASFRLLLAGVLTLCVAVVAAGVYNEYRLKSLTSILPYEPSEVESLEFTMSGSEPWKTSAADASGELYDFLRQYEIKKMSEADWDSNVADEEGFQFTVFTDDDIIGASIYENRLVLYSDGDYYTVSNGPVNMDWIASFDETFR